MPVTFDLEMGLYFGAAAVICLGATLVALRIGLNRVAQLEF